jgi:hypothetical protein
MTAMKRKRLWIAAFFAVLLVAAGVFLLWPPDRITRASFKKIHVGMTEKEVEALLGGPGIDRKSEDLFPIGLGLPIHIIPKKIEVETWITNQDCKKWEGRRGTIAIQFDPQGKVSGKLRIMATDRNIWDRLRDWLGL